MGCTGPKSGSRLRREQFREVFMSKLRLVILGTVLALTASGAFSQAEAAAAGLTKIRVGYPSPSASMYPLFVTKEAEVFEEKKKATGVVSWQVVQKVLFHSS